MRTCNNCGAELDDIEMKCPKCGSSDLSEIIVQDSEIKKMPRAKKIMIACIAAAVALVIAVIAVGSCIIIRNTETAPVIEGVKSKYMGDFDTYISKFDSAFQDGAKSAMFSSIDTSKYKEEIPKQMKEKYGDDYQITVKAVDMRNCSKNSIASLNEDYKSFGATIQDAKLVVVSVYVGGSNSEILSSETVYTVKINGKWSLFEDFSVTDSSSN